MARPRSLSPESVAFAADRSRRGDSHEAIAHALEAKYGVAVASTTVGRALARERPVTSSTPDRTTPRPSPKSKPVTSPVDATDERADLISLRRDLWARLPEASARDAAQISREVRQINERLATLDEAEKQTRSTGYDPDAAARVRAKLIAMVERGRRRGCEHCGDVDAVVPEEVRDAV